MNPHILLPGVDAATSPEIPKEYREWLRVLLEGICEGAEHGDVSSARCVAGVYAESWLDGELTTDWLGFMSDYLEVGGKPVAYSEKFGEKLNGYGKQWMHHDVHAIYARWWVERTVGDETTRAWAGTIERLIQPSGWIYNPDVSPTNEKYRMRSELFMQLAMGCEILEEAQLLAPLRSKLIAAVSSLGITGYTTAEFFRSAALQILNGGQHMPAGIHEMIERNRAPPGFADFNVAEKRDDYMGVAKRTSRDVAVFSPLCTLHALRLSERTGIRAEKRWDWAEEVRKHLAADPMGIPSFRMRDVPGAFGDGCTAFEIFAASALLR